MLALNEFLFEDVQKLANPVHVKLPSQLILGYAEPQDLGAILSYLKNTKIKSSDLEKSIDRGRILIFQDNEGELYGVAIARKTAQRVSFEVHLLTLSWRALRHIMVAALMRNELLRTKNVEFKSNEDIYPFIYQPSNVQEYLNRAANIEEIISGDFRMKLTLAPFMDEIDQIEQIQTSVLRRCGRA